MFKSSTVLLLAGLLAGAAADPLDQLEERLRQIDAELENLAHLSLRSDSGSIGYRSQSYYSADHNEWIQIELDPQPAFNEIVLVPVIRRHSKTEFKADGLPDRLQIRAGLPGDTTGRLIAEVTNLPAGTAPIIVPVNETKAGWIRIEVTQLNPRGLDGRFTFQLAEILVFNGEENIALHRPVTASTASTGHSDAWKPRFLVDGHMPYIMDTARGDPSLALIALGAQAPSLTIDLLQPQRISRIHLHGVNPSAMVPQEHFSDFGLPRRLEIEGAQQADFSDAVPLLDMRWNNLVEVGPVMMRRIPETECRYVRITAPTAEFGLSIPPIHLGVLANRLKQEQIQISEDSPLFRIGLAEIELFADGRNAALNKPVSAVNLPMKVQGEWSGLTDGRNLYGKILPVREWLHQLARRYELETERPAVTAGINHRLLRQKTNLRRMYWIAAGLVGVMAAGLVVFRLIHLHRMQTIKKRIAADLHDELGANLHAIGLFSELAKMELAEAGNAPLEQNLDEIRNLSETTAAATRCISRMLDAESNHENLVQEMQHTADRFLADLRHKASFPSEKALQQLPPRKRIDLYLFYKECLTNIIRHSGASEVKTALTLSGRRLTLSVSDNGIGLNGRVPHSLKRRAQLMHAKLKTDSSQNGTEIILQLRAKHRLSRKAKGRKVQCQ